MMNNNNKSESKLKVKRKPLEVRNFFGEENKEIRQKDSGKERELFVRIEDGRQDEGKMRIEPLREKPFNHMANHPTPNPTTTNSTDPQKPLQSPSTPSISTPFANYPTLP